MIRLITQLANNSGWFNPKLVLVYWVKVLTSLQATALYKKGEGMLLAHQKQTTVSLISSSLTMQ